jgi:PAS domain S-box-containing protein
MKPVSRLSHSLYVRIVAAMVACITLILAISTAVSINQAQTTLADDLLKRGESQALVLASAANAYVSEGNINQLTVIAAVTTSQHEIQYITFYDAQNTLLASAVAPTASPGIRTSFAELRNEVEKTSVRAFKWSAGYLDIVAPMDWFGQRIGSIGLRLDTSGLVRARAQVVTQGMVNALVLIFLLNLALGLLLRQLIIRPLRHLSVTAEQISQGVSTAVPGQQRRDQLGLLARSFAQMVAALQSREQQLQEQIVAVNELNTALQQTTAALQSSEARYHNIVANVPGMVYQIAYRPDGTGGFTFVSDGCRAIYGLSPAEILARPESVFNVVHPEDRAEIDRTIAEATSELKSWNWVGRALLPSGEERWHQCAAQPTLQQDGTLVWDGLMMDITDQKHAEEERARLREELIVLQEQSLYEMRVAKAEAEAANQAKTLFLSTTSHELRTPLTSVIGYSELLLRDLPHRSLEESQQDIRLIHTASQHLLTLINTILDLSKIEAGKMELLSESVDTDLLLDEVLLMVRPLAAQQGNVLDVLRPDELPLMHSDRTKVRQLLLNLLANAAKFTSAGRITLEARQIDHGDEPGVQFRVSDTGPGIAPGLLPRLFEPFVQDPEMARQRGGTGLGLALSRRLCRLMGGDISVESQLGMGTTFTVHLPLTAPPSPADSAPYPLNEWMG